MIIAIYDEVLDESCSMAINQWVDAIYTSLYCIIPSGLVTWDGWKNTRSPDVYR